MIPQLIALAGPKVGSSLELEGEVTIGRETFNRFSIPDRLLSRRHCKVVCTGAHCLVTDLGSANGTFVNGVPVKERVLAHGDLIQVGESLLLFQGEAGGGAADLAQALVQWDEAPLREGATMILPYAAALDWNAVPLHQLSVNARLAQDFQALLRIGLELNTLRSPEEIQQRLLSLLNAVIPAERGVFLLWECDELEFGCSFGWKAPADTSAALPVSRTIVQRVAREAAGMLYQNVPTEADLAQAQSLLYTGVQSVLAVPLIVDARVFGVLYLDTRNAGASFDRWHLQLATALANVTAVALQRARELQAVEAEKLRLQSKLGFALVGESQTMGDLRERIAQLAPTDSTILILGESGTGKEVVAQALYQASLRSAKPFMAINCAALTDSLLESELFGHEKGAFTGATTLKKGKFEVAEGGTIFLDEIGEMKPDLQAKLLRVLETRECQRVGGTRSIKLDIRIIAATNRDLTVALKEGRFRDDLFYRLNVFTIDLPPLREHRADIELLARFFINRFAQQAGRRVHGLDAAAVQCLQYYDWPGNVRELRNAMEYAVTLNRTGVILPEDLPAPIYETETPALPSGSVAVTTAPLRLPTTLKYRDAVKAARRQIILQAFAESGGDHQAAAQLLGLHPNNLHREIRQLNLREQIKSV